MAAAGTPAKAVLVTHNETSTGVTNPLEQIAREIRAAAPDALILVDAISSLGAIPFEIDAWDLDVVTTGSQKSWMVPPGLAMVAFSPRAWEAVETRRPCRASTSTLRSTATRSPRARRRGRRPSRSLRARRGHQAHRGRGLPADLRAPRCLRARRRGPASRRMGFRLLADPAFASNTVTSAWLPDGVEWSTFTKALPRAQPGARRWPGQPDRARSSASATWATCTSTTSCAAWRSSTRSAPSSACPSRRAPGHGRGTGRGRASHSAGSGAAAEEREAVLARGGLTDGGVDRHRTPSTTGRKRILVAEPLADEGLDILRADHDVEVKVGMPRDEFLRVLPEYDALLVRSQVQADAEAIAAGTRLQVIGRAGVGVDNIDLPAATEAGIVVVNAPTGNTIAAAEHTLALLFALARHIPEADASLRRGEWKRAQFTGRELRGKTLGIIGLGKIGMAIADRARAHGDGGPRARPLRDRGRGRPARREACCRWRT